LGRQTVRAYRKRHARPGEPVQLYAGMRTKACRKLVNIDPICIDLRHVLIAHGSEQPLLIEVQGRPLERDEIEAFAIADGFGREMADGLAAQRMADFWLKAHGPKCFAGVIIRWAPNE
jgi:hypothetical protein